MKALSIQQPWASLIIHGFKEFETRGQRCNYRGELAIHACKTEAANTWLDCVFFNFPLEEALQQIGRTSDDVKAFEELPRGAILGIVRVIDCIPSETLLKGNLLSAHEQAFGNYEEGRYGIRMAVRERFESPIPARGKQGLWNWERDA